MDNASTVSSVSVDRARNDRRARELIGLAEQNHVPVTRLSASELDALARGRRHSGVVAHCSRIANGPPASLESVLQATAGNALLLALDGVQDPRNLGACLRSADGAGADAVILPRDRACPITPTVRQVASGAADSVPLFRVTNLARTMDMLKQHGIWIVGTADDAAAEIFACDLSGAVALVFGGEGRGLRRLTRQKCDRLVRIPMAGTVASLNVSVAVGIGLYEVQRQRTALAQRAR